jgi:hypothetical protein
MAAAAALRIHPLANVNGTGHVRMLPLCGAAVKPAWTRSSSPSGAGWRAISRSVLSASLTPESFEKPFGSGVFILQLLPC